jgi:hypothetical protein
MNCEPLKTHVGIGDLIHIKQMLDTKKEMYNLIPISLNYEVLAQYKSDPNYIKFVELLFKTLFSSSPYKIQKNSIGFNICPKILNTKYNIKPEIPNLEKYFCCNSKEKNDEIIILTKIRGLRLHTYTNVIREPFLNILNSLSKNNKIVLMGEKVIGQNLEYEQLKNNHNDLFVYSIYEDIIKNIKIHDDYTIDELGNTSPNFDKFINDCQRLNKAKAVITLGTGGNVSMAMSCSNVICCYQYCEMEYLFSKMDNHPTKFLTNDYNQYFNKILSFI